MEFLFDGEDANVGIRIRRGERVIDERNVFDSRADDEDENSPGTNEDVVGINEDVVGINEDVVGINEEDD